MTLLSKAACKTDITATPVHALLKHTMVIIHWSFLMRLEPTRLCLSAEIFTRSRMGLRAQRQWISPDWYWLSQWPLEEPQQSSDRPDEKKPFGSPFIIHDASQLGLMRIILPANASVDFLLPLWFILPSSNSSSTISSFFFVLYLLLRQFIYIIQCVTLGKLLSVL